jgi:hypothetical protein
MDNKNIYIQRLALYAQHLSKIDLKTHPKRGQYQFVQMCEQINGQLNYFDLRTHSLLLDFHLWFPNNFYWNDKIGAAILKGMNPDENPFSSVIDFLGLQNPNEVLHLFSIDGLQSRIYGARFILEDSDIRDIGHNFSMFIRWKLSQAS